MKYLVFSDVHGNLPALEKLIKIERGEVDSYINLGDVVNYAPWGNECVELIDELENCINIRGNHETYFLNYKNEFKHPLVSSFYQHCYPRFILQDSISQYKEGVNIMEYKCKHTIEDQYVFHDTDITVNNNFIIGHSHQQFERKIGSFQIINPGSVGQNRKYINVANYIIWDTLKDTFDLKFFKFDVQLVINEMKRQDYPKECIAYYDKKKRLYA